MSAEFVILVWLGLITVLGLNGVGAGVAAMLHLWWRRGSRGAKIFLASAASGCLPASMMIAIGLSEESLTGSEGPLVLGLGFAMILAVAMVLSLPGAILVARKLDSPGDAHRAFE